jgi:predicted phage terminase large subunit-like protein
VLFHVKPTDAALELIHRRTVRKNLTEWCKLCGFIPAAHHKLLIDALEAVERGELQRLAVFMPPGSAKSTYASVLFPAHYLSQNPHSSVLAASHTTELAERFGRRVRNLCNEHSATLGITPDPESQAVGRWALTTGAEYLAAGVNTGIAGFRAKLGIIDDPVRSRQDADSELIRNRTVDWYDNDFRPRLVPGAAEVLIQTRWHELDLAGVLLDRFAWHVIRLPALAEPNDLLGRPEGWPLWNDDDYGYGGQLLDLAKNTPPRTWSALYQQAPTPDTGDYFKEEWLKPYVKAPARNTMQVYGASDYAVTANGGDYTVHGVFGLDPAGNIYLLDLWRGQKSSDVWVSKWCDLVKQWSPIGWAEEMGQIKSGVGPFLTREARERRAYCAREQFATRGDKSSRAQSIRGMMAMNGLYVPITKPWYAEFRSELLSFPAGKHDDQVDMLGLLGQLLDKMTTGRVPKSAEAKEPDDYRPASDEFNLQDYFDKSL